MATMMPVGQRCKMKLVGITRKIIGDACGHHYQNRSDAGGHHYKIQMMLVGHH